MRKRGWGGVRIGADRIYTLAYANDVVIMAEDEMRSLIPRLERYMKIYE